MDPERTSSSEVELAIRRERIRRGLIRANTAALLALLIVVALSLAAIRQAFQAEHNAQEASQAQRNAELQTEQARAAEARALLQQVRAQRRTGEAGQRFGSIAAASEAAAVFPSAELRDEAIAALALPDVSFVSLWTNRSPNLVTQFSPAFDWLAIGDTAGKIEMVRIDRNQVGAAYGDDAQMDSNYPLVRLSDSSGNVSYARTFNWSRTEVMTGNTPVTTEFVLNPSLFPGWYSLVTVANGINSDAISFYGPVWVDFNSFVQFLFGTYIFPYHTAAQGISAVDPGGTNNRQGDDFARSRWRGHNRSITVAHLPLIFKARRALSHPATKPCTFCSLEFVKNMRPTYVARIHECSLKGIELVAFNLFRVFSGIDGPGSELEFHSQPNNKARWMRLARHVLGISAPSWLKDESR